MTVSSCVDDNKVALRGVSVILRSRPKLEVARRRVGSTVSSMGTPLTVIYWSSSVGAPASVGVDVPARAGTVIDNASPIAAIDKRGTRFRRA
jgi:hypothetical protein